MRFFNHIKNSLNSIYSPNNEYDYWIDTACPVLTIFIFIAIIAPGIITQILHSCNIETTNTLKICVSLISTQVLLVLSPLTLAALVSKKISFNCKLLLTNWKINYALEALRYELVLFLPLLFLTIIVYSISSEFGYTSISPLAELLKNSNVSGLAIVFIFSVLIAPIVEEIVFRRIIFTFIARMFGILPAIILTSLIFAFLHGGVIQILPLFVLGCALQFLYIKNNSLFSPILLHSFHNFIIMGVFLIIKFRLLTHFGFN